MSLPNQIEPLSDDVVYICNNSDCVDDATYSYCVEADSMGAEYEYYCDEHIEEINQAQPSTLGTCEWCQLEDVLLTPVRDIEEGTHGPVYWVCSDCKKQQVISDKDEDDDEDQDLDEDDED